MVGLPNGEKTLRINITVYTQYWRVTDGQTDGQTSCYGIVHTMHMHRAAKMHDYALQHRLTMTSEFIGSRQH